MKPGRYIHRTSDRRGEQKQTIRSDDVYVCFPNFPFIQTSHSFIHILLPSTSITMHYFHISPIDATLPQHILLVQHRLVPLSHFLVFPPSPSCHHSTTDLVSFSISNSHYITYTLKHSFLSIPPHTLFTPRQTHASCIFLTLDCTYLNG